MVEGLVHPFQANAQEEAVVEQTRTRNSRFGLPERADKRDNADCSPQESAMPRSTVSPRHETIADLLEELGGISPARVRAHPPIGTATERHLLSLLSRSGRLYE